MNAGPIIKGNPLKVSVYLLIPNYLIGEFIFPKYSLLYFINLIGIVGLIISLFLFISSFNLFKLYKENPAPTSSSKKLIKTGIFAYTRNPIYLSFVCFHLCMFLVFENIMYFLTAIGLAIWIHNYVIRIEEDYLLKEFNEEYKRYMNSVKKWIFF
jgi:protein-S-isoprenylcysteine O-methyltransferase Ste14